MPIGITTDVLITCLGAVLGVVLGTRLPDSLKKALNNTLGIAAIAMGIVLILKVKNLSAVVLTLVIGSVLGELVMLDARIRKLVTGVVHKLMNGAAAADCIRSTKYGDVLPANMNLSGCSVELVSSEQREYIMKTALAAVQDDYDFILIDCPPSLELLTINALVAADSVLIPVQCEYYALEGIADLMRSIKMCNKRLNPELTVQGIVMTMYDGRTKLSDQVVNEVRKFFGKKVYKTMIPRNVRLSEAPSHRKPAIAYDKESKGARAYLHLAGELIKREEKAAKAAQEAAAAAAKEAEHG